MYRSRTKVRVTNKILERLMHIDCMHKAISTCMHITITIEAPNQAMLIYGKQWKHSSLFASWNCMYSHINPMFFGVNYQQSFSSSLKNMEWLRKLTKVTHGCLFKFTYACCAAEGTSVTWAPKIGKSKEFSCKVKKKEFSCLHRNFTTG